MATLLSDPCNVLTAWTVSSMTIATGRTGTGFQLPSGASGTYTVVSPQDTVTMGFAHKPASFADQSVLVSFWNNDGTVQQVTVNWLTNGTIQVRRGSIVGTVIASSAAGVMTANTWAYIEIQVKVHDTTGFVIVRVNGTEVINATSLDTFASGALTGIGRVRLHGGLAVTHWYDDIYIKAGAGDIFDGDTVIETDPCISGLRAPCDSITEFSFNGSAPTFVPGRTGMYAVSEPGGATTLFQHTIPAIEESRIVTVGFGIKFLNGLGTTSEIIRINGDAAATNHIRFQLTANGALQVSRSASPIAISSNGLITPGIWYYLEIKAFLHDTGGYVIVRINGAEVINAINLDTKNVGVDTVFDTIRFGSLQTGYTNLYDDIYINTGNCAFLGPQIIASAAAGGNARLARQTARALIRESSATAQMSRTYARIVNISPAGIARVSKIHARILNPAPIVVAPSVPVQIFDGTDHVQAEAVRIWDGTDWVDAEVLQFDGTDWV